VRHRCIHDSFSLSSLIFVESSLHRWLGSYHKCVDRIVAPSRFHREKLIEWGWPSSKLVHIPNYVKAEEFTPRYEPGEYFLYVGRLAPEKGITTLIEATRQTGTDLRVVGSGPFEPQLRELAADLPSITFCGYQQGETLRKTIRDAKVLVLPSELYENAPLSVLEALASGKPVLGARIGGIPELVVEGETGWLFESGDPGSLRERIRGIASLGDDRLIELGRSARAFVESRFSEQNYVDSMLELYRELGVDSSSQ